MSNSWHHTTGKSNAVSKTVAQTLLEQPGSHDHIPKELVPVLDQALSKDLYPNIQSELPLTHLLAIPSHAITEENSTFPSPSSYNKILHSNEFSPQVFFGFFFKFFYCYYNN